MIDTTTNTMSYYIAYPAAMASAETMAHIHGMATHTNPAGIVHVLPAGNPKIGSWVYPEAMERAICRGQTYVNIHSVGLGGGEIRGQIVTTVSPMDSMQETPPFAMIGSAGCGMYSFDEGGNVLGFDIQWGGIPSGETMAHIHGYAPPGAPAGIVFPLPLGARKLGTWAYTPLEEPRIFAGLAYANVHSVANGGGEIRGQIQPPPWTCPGAARGCELRRDGGLL